MKKENLYILLEMVLLIILILVYVHITYNFNLNLNIDFANIEFDNVCEDIEEAELDTDMTISAAVPIFMYHWIRDDTGDYEYPENMVKPDELRKQMEYLSENNYDVIFVSELNKIQHYEKPVILTFDDGWLDVYLVAFPLAKELNMKICMYVITDLIGTDGYCTLEQLQEMKESGLVEISSHTLSHPYLATLSASEIATELADSKTYLAQNLGIDTNVICYPYGSTNTQVLQIAAESYDYGLLMDGGVFYYNSETSDLMAIERIYATRSMTIATYMTYCEEAYVKIN